MQHIATLGVLSTENGAENWIIPEQNLRTSGLRFNAADVSERRRGWGVFCSVEVSV